MQPELCHTASACLTFLPSLTFLNELPGPVEVMLSRPRSQHLNVTSDQDPVQLMVVQPCERAPLPAVRLVPGESISWRLLPSSATASSATEHSSLAAAPSSSEAAMLPPATAPSSQPIQHDATKVGVASWASNEPNDLPAWSKPFSTVVPHAASRPGAQPSAATRRSSTQPQLVGSGVSQALPALGSFSSVNLPLLMVDPCNPNSQRRHDWPSAGDQRSFPDALGRPLGRAQASCMLVCSPSSADIPFSDHLPDGRSTAAPSASGSPADRSTSLMQPCTLTLLAHAAVVNDSPWWVRLEVPGASAPGPWVPPGQGLPMDWHPLRFRPRKVALAAFIPPGPAQQPSEAPRPGHLLHCQAFKVSRCLHSGLMVIHSCRSCSGSSKNVHQMDRCNLEKGVKWDYMGSCSQLSSMGRAQVVFATEPWD